MKDHLTQTGVLLVVCGPSGVGKTSLCDAILGASESLMLSISCTTRPPRPGEVDGRDYHFTSADTFESIRDDGGFVEWAKVHGQYYGTPVRNLEEAWAEGRDLLFDIDVQGARQIKNEFPGATLVMIVPPDMQTLEQRLRGRDTDAEEVIEQRLSAAKKELQTYEQFDFIIENTEFDQALADLEAVYRAAQLRTQLRGERVQDLLD